MDLKIKLPQILRSTKQPKAVQTGFAFAIFPAETWTEGGRVYCHKTEQTTIVDIGDIDGQHLDRQLPSESDQ